jgi:hypothetical protein
MGEYHHVAPFDLFRSILSDSRTETLLKVGQTRLLRYFVNHGLDSFNDFWTSIKISIRNGYVVEDAQIWIDYLNLLRFFGKDLHNAVCPANLIAAHDRYVRKKREWQEQERREQEQQKAKEDEALFKEMKSHFFGIQFTDGIIQVQMLESAEDIRQEGNAMHHCVFANEYHLKRDSLILSACVNGQRMETVEFSLSQMQVVQCRGVCNKATEYHDRIINLVNRNKRQIKKRMIA